MKFFLSVVALPVSVLTVCLFFVVGSLDTAGFGYGFLMPLTLSFFILAVLSIRISYSFFNRLRFLLSEKDQSLTERTNLANNQRRWIENLEADIEYLQGRISTISQRQVMVSDPVCMASHTQRPAFVLDSERSIGYVNEGFEKLTGYTLNTVLGYKLEEVLAGPETTDRDLQLLRSGLDKARPFTQEILNYKDTGTSFNASITFQPVETNQGLMYLAFIEDITAMNEDKLKLQIFEQMANNLEEVVFVTDREGAIEWVNKKFEQVTEYSSEEVIGRKAESFLRSRFRKPVNGVDDYSLTEAVYNYTKRGRGYWSSLSVSPIYNGLGEIEKFIAIESEIKEVEHENVQEMEDRIRQLWEDQYSKSAELEKREEELVEALQLCDKIKKDVESLWLTSEQLDSAVIITDRNGNIEWVNEGFEKVFDCKFSEVAGKKPHFAKETSPVR